MPGVKISVNKKNQLLKLTQNQCIYCNILLSLETMTIEHIYDKKLTKYVYGHSKKPYSRNLAPACSPCNVGRKSFPLQYGLTKGSLHLTKIKKLMKNHPYPIDLVGFNNKINYLM